MELELTVVELNGRKIDLNRIGNQRIVQVLSKVWRDCNVQDENSICKHTDNTHHWDYYNDHYDVYRDHKDSYACYVEYKGSS